MANFRLQIVPPGAGFPTRVNSEESEFDFQVMRIGDDNLPISQDGAGANARLKLVNRLTVPAAINDDEIARWDQVKEFVTQNLGQLEWQPSVNSVIKDPPVLPTIGDRYLIDSPATGVWLGREWSLVEYMATGWVYTTCTLGTFVFIDTMGEFYVKANTNWVLKAFDKLTASAGLKRVLDDLQIDLKGVTTDKIADYAVENLQVADDAIATRNIQDNAITNVLMADDSVGTAELIANSVTQTKMALLSVGTPELIADSVTGDKIPDGAVNTEHIYGGAVTEGKIATGAVTNAKIGTGAVDAFKLATDAVETLKIKDLNVTEAKLADSAVANAKIAASAVTGNKLLPVIKSRIGVATDTTMEAYTSTNIIGAAQNYPQALSTLDNYVQTALTSLPQEQRFVTTGPTTSITCTSISWVYGADILDITVRINGKLLTQSRTTDTDKDYTKASTTVLNFPFTIQAGNEIVVRKERTGGVSGDTALVVKDAGTPVNVTNKVLNFTGTGVTLESAGPDEVNVVITAGSGGVDLGNITTDIVPATDDTRVLGSVTKGFKALYLVDSVTGLKYRVEVNNGIFQAVEIP